MGKIDSSKYSSIKSAPNSVMKLATADSVHSNIPDVTDDRKAAFAALQKTMVSNTPTIGKKVVTSDEMYETNILKGSQEAKTWVDNSNQNKSNK